MKTSDLINELKNFIQLNGDKDIKSYQLELIGNNSHKIISSSNYHLDKFLINRFCLEEDYPEEFNKMFRHMLKLSLDNDTMLSDITIAYIKSEFTTDDFDNLTKPENFNNLKRQVQDSIKYLSNIYQE